MHHLFTKVVSNIVLFREFGINKLKSNNIQLNVDITLRQTFLGSEPLSKPSMANSRILHRWNITFHCYANSGLRFKAYDF